MSGIPMSPGENLGENVVIPQLEEKIDGLQCQLDNQKQLNQQMQQNFDQLQEVSMKNLT